QVLFIPGVSPGRARQVKSRRSDPDDLMPTGTVHVVRRGETLSGIAGRYGMTVSQLKRLNRLWGKRYIYPNQRLRISSGKQFAKGAATGALSGKGARSHIVAPGDSLWLIARKYGVSVELLRRANGLQGRSLIKPGQRLTIPVSN
ncbi:MAG TPA: LysM domain-containing protein, partial [Bacteroidetes bacterium]|nr:LysM domain-containing protein [Bacteroidota bacterium]